MFNVSEDIHEKQVSLWEQKLTKGLTSEELVELYAYALERIEKRALKTLSAITLMVVFDRIIHQNKTAFPALAEIKNNENSTKFYLYSIPSKNFQAEQIAPALRCMLIEILNVLGRITANILTDALHSELQSVTWEEAKKAKKVRDSSEDK